MMPRKIVQILTGGEKANGNATNGDNWNAVNPRMHFEKVFEALYIHDGL